MVCGVFPPLLRSCFALGAALLLSFCWRRRYAAADITVTTTADNTIAGDGQCTLRDGQQCQRQR